MAKMHKRRRRTGRSEQHTQEPARRTDCKARATHTGREFQYWPQDRLGTGRSELGLVDLVATQDRASGVVCVVVGT